MRVAAIAILAASAACAVAAPLIGLSIAGLPLEPYLDFPPRTQWAPAAPFAWDAFALLSVPVVGAIALFGCAIALARPAPASIPRRPFPAWGWIGIGICAAGWILAWSDDVVPGEWRRQTFLALWLGYILVMNGLAIRRTGRSPLTHRTGWFLALFPASALLWWLFEFLNQFVRNWHYSGIEALDDWDYFVQATLPFSSVLPAVASTWAWLRSFPRLDAMRLPPLRGHPALGWIALAAGALGLGGIGVRPDVFYAMLWLAPLLVLCGLQQAVLGETYFAPLARGDWRPLLQPALAALVCGFFWEMWNYGSLAKWHYSIPYAQRFHVFEMPLLGYAGYLPFGVECALIMDLVARIVERRPLWPLDPGQSGA
jgi:hypothetical protein